MSCENDGMLFCSSCDGQKSVFSASFDVSWGVYMRKEIVWASWANSNGHQKTVITIPKSDFEEAEKVEIALWDDQSPFTLTRHTEKWGLRPKVANERSGSCKSKRCHSSIC